MPAQRRRLVAGLVLLALALALWGFASLQTGRVIWF